MAEVFVTLATFLRAPQAAAPTVAEPRAPVAAEAARAAASDDVARDGVFAELALMRLAAGEAFERSATRALAAFAADVLGRELVLAPVDLEVLIASALVRFAECEPIAIALAPADARRVRAPLPIRIDPTLAEGDFVVDVRDGSLESTFAFRLRDALT